MKRLIAGLVSCVPGMYDLFSRKKTGGTISAEYCYEVWMKHLTFLGQSGMNEIPRTVAELGPGDSLGVGLAALLSGVERYYALDVVEYSNIDLNISIFDELVGLFRRRASRPSEGWPDYGIYLDSNLFPSHILTEELLDTTLTESRVESIRKAILGMGSGTGDSIISYIVPWNESHIIDKESVDLIYSHAVLEHITDLADTYEKMWLLLRPGGFLSHQIGLTSHGLTKEWNGYWATPELLWKLAFGRRPYLINRQPCSKHLELLESNGFEIILCYKDIRDS
ncbi:MAG: methyltransferase domain-containing protein, partial [Candidatus Krumholzibacteria bacterium]|nr:methyltransferase domain-containing protein [Candidatus Krumholzibacteria bacterium]